MASMYGGVRLVTPSETHIFTLIPRVTNSSYEYEKKNYIEFRGRPAQSIEKKNYRLQKGVNTSTDSVYIVSSSMPDDIRIGDKVVFLGKPWTVSSVGYYFDQNLIVNSSIFKEDYIIAKCPKGFTLS